jgi:hypothetical protein
MVIIVIKEKFTVHDFPMLMNNFYNDSLASKEIIFDLERLEWISLEAITFLFGWINNLKNKNKSCTVKVKLPNPNILESDKSGGLIDYNKSLRRERRLISLLETWYFRFFCDINADDIINPPSNQYYDQIEDRRKNINLSDNNWHKIIPFRKLDTTIYESLENIRTNLDTELNEIFTLEEDVSQILDRFSTKTPFINKTLSHLITVELLLNTIHHSKMNSTDISECYFSISHTTKFNREDIETELYKKKIEIYKERFNCSYNAAREKIDPIKEEEIINELNKRITNRLPRNIESERLSYTLSFFKERNENRYKNQSYIEFTYLDFGIGIPVTLKQNYSDNIGNQRVLDKLSINHFKCESIDSRILEYAFLLDSSKNPFNENIKIQNFVPRGLYFLLETIRLYKGLLIVRSRKGEIVYDFSKTNKISESVLLSSIGYDFPGTMISIIIPEQLNEEIKVGPIQEIKKISVKSAERKYISILDIYRRFQERYTCDLPFKSIDLYNFFFYEINNMLDEAQANNSHTIIYLDFAGANLSYIDYKIFYFLSNTPKINNHTNIVLLNIINKSLLRDVRNGLMNFEPFIFRPIPCIIEEKDGIDIKWIGIKSPEEEHLLNSLLKYNDYTLPSSDFQAPELLSGNVFEVNWLSDSHDTANIQRSIFLPSINEIEYVNSELLNKKLKQRILHPSEKDENILLKPLNSVFLTSGGYYQYEFLKFIDLLFNKDSNNRAFSERIAISLFNTWRCKKGRIPDNIDWILTVTLSSQMLGRDVKKVYRRLLEIDENKKTPRLLKLAHYYEFSSEIGFEQIKKGENVLVVNDVISTGSLNFNIYNSLKAKKANVVAFFSIVDCRISDDEIDPETEKRSLFNSDLDNISISLVENFPIHKYLKNIRNCEKVIKINPIINAPTTMELQHSESIKIIYPNVSDVLRKMKPEHLLIGYFINNKSHHTYFPNTENIFLQYSGKEFLRDLINKVINIEKKRFQLENQLGKDDAKDMIIDYVFFPVFSGIEAFEDYHFQQYFNNKNLHSYPIPRIDTIKGWRFTFPPKILNKITEHKTVFILDDGSCSGETILQMIDSICFLDVRKIIVLSVFGRLEDFQREFFSRIKKMKVKNLKNNSEKSQDVDEPIIDTHIYFGTHLNIHHYPFEQSTSFINENKILESHLFCLEKKPKTVDNYIRARIKDLNILDVKEYNADEFIIPKHLPVFKDTKTLDVVRFYEIRNILGRLDSYRIYKQYYDETEFVDRCDLEIIIGIVNHEPQILETIKHLLPELFLKLKNEINRIVFEEKFEESKQYYLWNKEALLMFLFLIDSSALFSTKKLTILFDILNKLDDNIMCLGLITYKLWQETINNGEKGILVRATVFEIWYSFYKQNQIKSKHYSLLTSLVDSFSYKDDVHSVSDAFYNLNLFFQKEIAKPGHKQIEKSINSAIPTLQDFSTEKLDIVLISNAIDDIKKYLNKNLNKLYESDLAKKYLKSIYGYLFESENSIYGKISEIIDIDEKLKEVYTTNSAAKIQRSQYLREKLSTCLLHLNRFFIDGSSPFADFCLKFYTNPIESWKQIIKYHTNIIGYDNVSFNLDELIEVEQISLPIHRDALDLAFLNILHNICEKALYQKLNLHYKIDQTNGILLFSIEQDKQFTIDDTQIEGTGLDLIKNVIRIFNGDVYMPLANQGHNMYYHLVFPIINDKKDNKYEYN